MIADMIAETADRPSTIPATLKRLANGPLVMLAGSITEPLARLVYALAGIDPDADPDAEAKHKAASTTFREHHEKLFVLATGALGWTPAEAWQATPAEIMAAYEGRMELLAALFGGTPDKPQAPGDLDQKFRTAFASIGTKKVKREKRTAA
ncbi:phage tail assembly chaperone [Propylenella binzhouense]|uniref:phage tail assembly chaperone n=1 Tax=Propylenella binzhouense TaxID=2555902 RepID=UPI0031B6046D